MIRSNHRLSVPLPDEVVGNDWMGRIRADSDKPLAPDNSNRLVADLNVARIVGVDTIEQGRIVNVSDGLATIEIGRKQLVALAPPVANGGSDTEAYVCIHAEDVTLEMGADLPQTSARNHLVGRIRSLDREGPIVRVNLDCGFQLKALITHQSCQNMRLQEQSEVVASIKATAIHLIARG